MIRFVLGILPALVIYTDKLPKDWQGGVTQGPVIRLRPKYKDDPGILAHELVHVRQWYLTLTLHSLLHLLVPRYKLWSEVQAYREQAKHYAEDRRPQFAEFLASRYGLDITASQALERLK
jgi:hypothetical protein